MQAQLYAKYRGQLKTNPKGLIEDLKQQRRLGARFPSGTKTSSPSDIHPYSDRPECDAIQRTRQREQFAPSRRSLGRAFPRARPAQGACSDARARFYETR